MSNYIENDKSSYDKLLKITCDIYCMFSIPCVVGCSFLARSIINLFCGKQFSESIIIMQVISLTIFFMALSGFFMDQVFIPRRKDKYTMAAVTSGAIMNFTFNLILIPKYHALGAAIATVISEFSVFFISFILSIRILKFEAFKIFKNLWQYILSTFIMYLLLTFLSHFFIVHNLLYLTVSIFSSVLIYILSLLLLRNQLLIRLINIIKEKLV